jgi:hypothetical protein
MIRRRRMRLRALAGSICCAALLAALPAGAQAKPPIPTTISFDDDAIVGTQVELIGHLTSPNRKCLSGRRVRLLFTNIDFTGRKLVDTDITSVNGIWAGSGSDSGTTSARAKVVRKTFGPRGHRRTCAAATVTLHFA